MALHEIPALQFTPESNIHLLSGVPLNKDYQHTRLFNSKTEQTNYFLSKQRRTLGQASYIRKDNIIRFDMNAEQLFDVNYLMFQNSNFSGKWFYAFVTNVEYKNPNTTFIHFQIDVMQTWLFDFTVKPSYVDREHRPLFLSNGLPVVNTIDEGLDYGTNYHTVLHKKVEQVNDMVFAIISTKVRIGHTKDSDVYYEGSHNGMPSTLNYYIVPIPLNKINNGVLPNMYYEDNRLSSITDLYSIIATESDLQNMITSISFTSFIPFSISYTQDSTGALNINSTEFEVASFGNNGAVMRPKTYASSKRWLTPQSEGLYEPFPNYSESKLYMYPYSFVELTDQKGNKREFHLEYTDRSSNRLALRFASSVSHQPKTAVWIDGYNVDNTDNSTFPEMDKALIIDDIQDVPIISDYTATYLQGNRNSHNASIFNTLVNGASGITMGAMTMNPYATATSAVSMLTSITTLQAKKKDIDNRPPSLANMGKNANFDISNGNTGVWITYKTIKSEYKEKLESYFKLFGYKMNEVKVPDLKSRTNWNYIKTVGCVLQGSIIQNDLEKIRQIFDNGITFWHTNDVGNYNLSNEPR